jgi:mitogen-activated protein kinase organizer 1
MAAATFPDSPVRIPAHNAPIHALAFSSGSGQYLLTGSADRTVKLLNPATRRQIQSYQAHGYEVLDIAVSGDNARFASVGGDKTVFLWDVATAQTLRRFNGHAGRINACAFGGDEDSVLCTGSFDGTVKVWDCKSRSDKPIMTFGDAKDAVSSIAVRGAEIIAGSIDGRVRVYDLRSGEVDVDVLATSGVTSVAPSTDGEGYLVSTLDATMRFMDRPTGKCLQTFRNDEFRNVTYRVRSTFAMADSLAVSGTEDGGVFAWDVLSGQLRHKLWHRKDGAKAVGEPVSKKDVVSAVAWNQMRKQLASAGGDGEVCVWNVET